MKRDPVCGREVDTLRARAVAIIDGEPRYFCSAACKNELMARRRNDASHMWDEPTPLPPVVAPEAEPEPRLALARPRPRRGLWASLVGLFRRFTL